MPSAFMLTTTGSTSCRSATSSTCRVAPDRIVSNHHSVTAGSTGLATLAAGGVEPLEVRDVVERPVSPQEWAAVGAQGLGQLAHAALDLGRACRRHRSHEAEVIDTTTSSRLDPTHQGSSSAPRSVMSAAVT